MGGEVLAQLVDRTEVLCLTRRPVAVDSPRISTIVHQDFTVYPGPLAERLSEADGCVWALGGKASDSQPDEYLRATFTSTVALVEAVAPRLRRPFRFCYLSGMGADPSESSTFYWEKTTRHLKGRTERALEGLTQRYPLFSARSFRPGGILPKCTGALCDFLLAPIAVRVDRLARVLIDEALSVGGPGYAVISNRMIRRGGL